MFAGYLARDSFDRLAGAVLRLPELLENPLEVALVHPDTAAGYHLRTGASETGYLLMSGYLPDAGAPGIRLIDLSDGTVMKS